MIPIYRFRSDKIPIISINSIEQKYKKKTYFKAAFIARKSITASCLLEFLHAGQLCIYGQFSTKHQTEQELANNVEVRQIKKETNKQHQQQHLTQPEEGS